MKAIETWAHRYDVPPEDARKLRRLVRKRCREATAECNGDPHPRVADPADKNTCVAAWSIDEDATLAKIRALLLPLGMTYDAGTGLWGSVMKDGHYLDILPDKD